jgi:hypothetical protein
VRGRPRAQRRHPAPLGADREREEHDEQRDDRQHHDDEQRREGDIHVLRKTLTATRAAMTARTR